MSIARQYGMVAPVSKPVNEKTVNEIRKAIPLTRPNIVNAKRGSKNTTGTVAAVSAPVAQAAATASPGTSKRGRKPKPDAARKDMAAYMRARRAKKP